MIGVDEPGMPVVRRFLQNGPLRGRVVIAVKIEQWGMPIRHVDELGIAAARVADWPIVDVLIGNGHAENGSDIVVFRHIAVDIVAGEEEPFAASYELLNGNLFRQRKRAVNVALRGWCADAIDNGQNVVTGKRRERLIDGMNRDIIVVVGQKLPEIGGSVKPIGIQPGMEKDFLSGSGATLKY